MFIWLWRTSGRRRACGQFAMGSMTSVCVAPPVNTESIESFPLGDGPLPDYGVAFVEIPIVEGKLEEAFKVRICSN